MGINDWPISDRPRERLFEKGVTELSNTELLAILLRLGVQGQSALDLARSLMARFKDLRGLSKLSLTECQGLRGLGRAKIAVIKAALELGRRFWQEEVFDPKREMRSPKMVFEFLLPLMRDLDKEEFKVILLTAANHLIKVITLTKGTVAQVEPFFREIFEAAILNYAAAVICVHNHPSGDPTPSQSDIDFTEKLKAAGRLMEIPVLDHIIMARDSYFSFEHDFSA